MRVLWLKDSKAGHRNKVAGLLRALGKKASLQVTEVDVQWKCACMRHVLARLGNAGLSLSIRWFLRGLPDLGDFDLIVSSGGATQWPNAALAKQRGVINVFIGSIRSFSPDAFSVIASHDPQSDELPFFRFELIPSVVSPESSAAAAKEFLGFIPDDWGLLLGGDGEGLSWSKRDYVNLTNLFIEEVKQSGAQCWVATSRRTPPDVESEIKRMFDQAGCLRCACWFHGREPDDPPFLVMLGASQVLVVGADSMSMAHEAVSSGAKVIAVSPQHSKLNERAKLNLLRLEDRGLLKLQSIASLSIANAIDEGDWNQYDGDPVAALAETVLNVVRDGSS